MDKNEFTNKYISLLKSKSNVEKNIDALAFRADEIAIIPTHFNYFYFKVVTYNLHSALTVKEARALGEWLIKATENIENAHGIIEDLTTPIQSTG